MRRKIIVTFIFLCILCLSVSCLSDDNVPDTINAEVLSENTTMYDASVLWLKEDYKASNYTRNAGGQHTDGPVERIVQINTEKEFDKAFKEFPTKIDFDKQMLILYFYTGNNLFSSDGKRLYYHELKNVIYQNQSLTFECVGVKTAVRKKGEEVPDATLPFQRCVTFVVPKLKISQIDFKLQYKSYYITWDGDLKSNATLLDADTKWLTDESKTDIKSEEKTNVIKIRSDEELKACFNQFDYDIDFERDMLLVFCVKEENGEADYKYEIEDVQYKNGFLDITLVKNSVDAQNEITDEKLMVVKLPQLPAFNIDIRLN